MIEPSRYSGTPLAAKLGLKEGHRLVLLAAPADFAATLEPLPPVTMTTALGGAADVIVLFCRARRDLEDKLAAAHAALDPAGGMWIAWPKKASKVATDMTEDVVRSSLHSRSFSTAAAARSAGSRLCCTG